MEMVDFQRTTAYLGFSSTTLHIGVIGDSKKKKEMQAVVSEE